MTVQCYQYAATAFREVSGSPRPTIALGNFFGLHSGLEEWFDLRTAIAPVSPGAAEAHGAPPGEVTSWQMGLGDLVVFPDPIRHVGVATGLGDLLTQSGYNVQSARRAQRLRELHTLGRKQQLPKTLQLGWRGAG